MQGLDISNENNFEQASLVENSSYVNNSPVTDMMPNPPPESNSQVAAWYDTDL